LKREINLPKQISEGWGLVKRYEKDVQGREVLNFYITDGSHKIFVVDGETWEIKRIIEVGIIS